VKRNGQLMRQRIVGESMRLFVRKGFHGTTIKDIASAVNLTKGSIYWYFEGKDDLLEAILAEWEESFLNGLIAFMEGESGSFEERFRAYHKYCTEYAVSHRDLCVVWTILAAEIAGSGMKGEGKFRDLLERYLGFVRELIDEGKREGVVKAGLDSHVLANVILGIHDGVLLQWYMKQDDVTGHDLAMAYRTVLLAGILENGTQKTSG
jgi:AcrR family transcriptional regulator